jgi:hypothetical protein
MQIVVFAHLLHRDYPWSVGKLKRLRVQPATDENMRLAEAIVARIDERREAKRLRAFWELRAW